MTHLTLFANFKLLTVQRYNCGVCILKVYGKIPVDLFTENHLENNFEFQCANDFLNYIPLLGYFEFSTLYKVINVEFAVLKFKVKHSFETTLNFYVQMIYGETFNFFPYFKLLNLYREIIVEFAFSKLSGTTFRICLLRMLCQ